MFDGDWTGQARCAGTDPEIFFTDTKINERRAKGICAGCPVRLPCLDEAMAAEIPKYRWGIWGGTGPRERNRIARRKNQAA